MSSLLQSVLSAKLAGTSLDDEGRANANANNEDWEEVNTSDEELVAISTAPGTGTATPLNISRPTSPGSTSAAASKLKSSPLLGNERPVKFKAPKSKTDPLRSLPKEASQRIFLSLSIYELLSLSLVCKRYRKSATLNYCWYRKCLAEFDAEDAAATVGGNTGAGASLAAGNSPVGSGGGGSGAGAGAGAGARWTRRESRTDWKKEYFRRRNQERKDLQRSGSAPGSGTATPSRSQRLADSGVKTTRDMREEQWKEEATQQEEGYTKNEMRSYYKEAGGSKGGKAKGVKASRGKGGSRGVDEGLWE